MNGIKKNKNLSILCFTELCERFSYFGIQSLLVLVMTQHLKFDDANAYFIFGLFGSLLFLSPLLGGYLADKYLGHSHTALVGCIFLTLGYLFLIFANNSFMLFSALPFIVLGNGLFKPNISTLLGKIHSDNNTQNTRAFTLFYVAINIGSVIGVISCGFIYQLFNFHIAFALCAAFTLIAFFALFTFKRSLTLSLKVLCLFVMLYFGIFYLFAGNIKNVYVLLSLVTLGFLTFILIKSREYSQREQKNIYGCLILVGFSIIFWALYLQSFMSVMLYISRLVDLSIGSITLPASTVGSLNGIFLVLFSPFLLHRWKNTQNMSLNTMLKYFISGILFMGVGYIVLGISAKLTGSQGVFLYWIILSYALQTLGELLLAPIGLTLISQLAPENLKSTMMGIWFLALAGANMLGSFLSKLAHTAKDMDLSTQLSIYNKTFFIDGLIGIVAAILLFTLMNFLKSLITLKSGNNS